ncbi:ribosomal protection-like ABC-F family protein [Helicobacter canis]|uniref:ABC-F family ATP-binding cassette domain-containing protein n=1 Tax=Helicobacter canis TaxID=29419 RepID=A0A5M9QTV7_9HELI|nr:ABC-F family ATP-binding cassette domain-containing protein [Helicobacter canis]KAA8711487.1 ABC-F family ATP-binding cassette domain-containing protein [Helicobacter canis]
MALLSLHNAYKSFGARKVLENASLSLDDGERVAIIGKNGAGKSTLLKILCEQMPLDSGTLAKRPNLVARILPQDPHFRVDLSVREVCEASLQELVAIHKRVDEINALLQADSRELTQNTELLNELGTLTTQLDSIDGWDLEKRITELIENFHLKDLQDRAIGTLSGGELKRLALATILMQPADLYILDEPTNHLDVEVVEFLESKLNALKACVLFISHDRYFIDNCARRIIEVDSSKLTNFRGGYGAYLSQKAAMLESLAKEHSRTLKLLKAEEEWLHKGVQARRKRNVLRKERVELLRAKAKQNPSLMRQMRLELERESKHHNRTHSHNAQKMIIECENLCVSMGGKPLIKDCSLRILQGDKIAIVGRNGAGKSSLLKVFLGEIAPQSGAIKRGELKIGYFAQTRKELDDSKSLIETFCPNGGDHIEVKGKSMHIYGYLKSFLFPKDLLTQKIGALSGGEKTRVSLALLFTKQYDCLLLDEPTNDLDIATINILEEYLLSFSGALLLVSHDRYFIDKLAQKLLILHNPLQLDSSARGSRGESSVEESLQSFSEYLELSKEIAYYKQLESSLTNRDSALGEQCGSVAKIVKGTTTKVANLPQFLQSSHSPTAIPRILEENQSSLQGDTIAEAIHTNAQKLDSSIEEMDCHADKSARNDDENAQIPNKLAKDSRINKNAQNVFSPNADRRQDLGDKNGALQEQTWAHTRAYVTADSPQQNKGYRSALADVSLESPFLAPKPTPKNKKLSYNEQRELATLPERIQSLEAQKQLIEQRLSDEISLARYGVVALASELESIAKELDSSYERYFFLEEKQESLKR